MLLSLQIASKSEHWPKLRKNTDCRTSDVNCFWICLWKIICYLVSLLTAFGFSGKSQTTLKLLHQKSTHLSHYLTHHTHTTSLGVCVSVFIRFVWRSHLENAVLEIHFRPKTKFETFSLYYYLFFLGYFTLCFQYKWQTKNGKHINKRAKYEFILCIFVLYGSQVFPILSEMLFECVCVCFFSQVFRYDTDIRQRHITHRPTEKYLFTLPS